MARSYVGAADGWPGERAAPSRERGPKTAKSAEPRRGSTLSCSRERLLLVATLVARLAKKLAVLLLRHALATLLDDGTHQNLTEKIVPAARAAAERQNASE
ncbi:hypothetical protein GCM10009748_10420 [Agromyces lapidis]